MSLVPELDQSVPATGDDLGGLVGVPQGTDAHLIVCLDPVVQLGGLPVPDIQLPIRIARHHIATRERGMRRERREERKRLGSLLKMYPVPFHLRGCVNLGFCSKGVGGVLAVSMVTKRSEGTC